MRTELLSRLTQRDAKCFTKLAILTMSYYTTPCFSPTNCRNFRSFGSWYSWPYNCFPASFLPAYISLFSSQSRVQWISCTSSHAISLKAKLLGCSKDLSQNQRKQQEKQ